MNMTLEETLSAKVRMLTPTQQQYVLGVVEALGGTVMPPGIPGASWTQFAGSISPEDLALMEQAIEEGCEKVDTDAW